MKERKRYRTLFRTVYSIQKRFLAFLLAAAMILTNVGADINTVFAASSSESVTFSMSGSQLVKAIDKAIANGNEVTAEDLNFTNGKIAEFEKLFFGDGKIYEAYPEPEGGSMDAELRVFVRLPEDANNMYMATGDEEIIFLYVNNGENTINCTTEITRMDNGVEKVKKTPRITVKSYEAAYGDEEVNVISKPAETTAPAATESQAETKAPEETTAAPDETQVGLPEETAALEESQAEEVTEEKTQEAAQPEETEAPAEDASEVEITEPVASVIRHHAPVVAANENGDAAVTTEEPKETGALTEEKATEAADLAETTQAPAEETTADSKVTIPDIEETASAPAESESAYEDGSKAESAAETAPDVASPSESKPAAETSEPEDKASAAGTGDLVGIGYCSTAKAYVTTINQLKAFEDYEGYKISYTIHPEASARIIEGPRGVEESQALTFGVKNQIGYAVESVTANGESLTADSITDNEDATQTVWYSVPEIYEDQEVEVNMTETGEHPAFVDSVTINGVTITATASEGVIPAGTKLDAKEVSVEIGSALKDKVKAEDGVQVTSVLAYDINLILNGTKLDNSWSDNGYVTVTFSGSRIKEETAEGSSVEIYAVDDNNAEELNADTAASATADTLTLENVGETVDVSGDSGVSNVSFEAEHFTIYAITIIGGEEKPAVATYNFYNGEELINTQKVKDGDTLVEPQIPASESNKFLGWSTDTDQNNYQVFGTVAVTDTETINLHARFDQVYYVFFNYNGIIRQIKQANTGQSVTVKDVDIEVAGDEALTGWALSETNQVDVGNTVTVTNKDINLYPIIQKVKWIIYYANGGSYTNPAYVGIGQKTVAPANPTRLGYSFGGWYTDTALTKAFTFGNTLASDISLYAKWNALTGTQYTVIHWKQNANDSGYSFAESQTLTGKTEAQTSAAAKNYSGFTAKAITQSQIAGDGSTIVNVFYDRNIYQVLFKEYVKTGIFSWGWVPIDELTISAKYEQNISQLWPSIKYPNKYDANWKVDSNSSVMQAGLEMMPLNGEDFFKYESSGNNTYSINHYLEVVEGSTGGVSYNGKSYITPPRTEIIKSDSLVSTPEDHYDITGFTYSNNITYKNNRADFTKVSNGKYKIDFYYYRNSYDIKFMNNGSLVNSISKQYEANISGVNYTPTRPGNVPSDYYFMGWYDNASFAGAAYSFTGKTMPAMNITLYAKWAAPQFKVKFDISGGTGNYSDQTVNYGNTASQPDSNPTKAGYTFAGWTLDGTIFNFNTQIYKNINLVARWISTHTLKVVYDAGEGSGVVPVDSSDYVDGSRAAVRPGNTLTHSGGKVFIGWKLGEEVYYPGETFVVDSSLAVNNKVTLVAQWAVLPENTFLTYHANFGNDATETVSNIVNNDTITIVDGNELFEREGYIFEKWTTERDGKGSAYNGGDTAVIDNIGSNDLYAQWIMCKDITIKAASQSFEYDGASHSNPAVTVAEGTLAAGDVLVAEAKGSVTNVADNSTGNNKVEPGYKIMNGTKDVTAKYNITVKAGTLTVTPMGVSIKAANSDKIYGAKDPVFAKADIGEYIKDELKGINLSVARSDAGDDSVKVHEGVLTIGKTAEELNHEYPNYSFTVTPGDFTIKTNEEGLSVSAENVSKVYDGTGYGVSPVSNLTGATITYKDADGNYTLTTSPTRKDVGTTTVYFKASLYGYADAYGSADVIISKKDVTIEAANSDKIYGAKDPVFAKADISEYIEDDLAGINLSVTRSDAGDDSVKVHEGVLTIGKTAEELNGEYPNYSFTVNPGDFTIKTNEEGLSVSAKNVSEVYDGTGYGVSPASNLTGATITYKDADGNYTLTTSPIRKDVGTTTVYFKASLYGYADAYGSADVVISKKDVTIKAANSDKIYGAKDPAFAKADISEYIEDDLIGIDLSVIRSDASDDSVKVHESVLTIGKTAEELNDEYPNYSFTVTPGDFTIKTNEEGLSVSAENVSEVYNGTGYGVSPTSSLAGATITYKDTDGNYTLTTSPTRKDVGTTTVEFKASLYGYADAYGSADVIISKKDVTIKAANSDKIYGAKDPAFAKADISEYIEDDLTGIDLSVTRSDASDDSVKVHKGVLTIGKTAEELNGEYPNYSFTVTPGDFTIKTNEEDLSVSAKNVSKAYDGTGYGVSPTSSLEGATITYKDADGNYTLAASPARKDVGTTTVYFKARLYGYADAYGSAEVIISKKDVTIKAADSDKVYGEKDPAFAKADISKYIEDDLIGIDLRVTRSDAGDDSVKVHESVLTIGKTAEELNDEYPNYSFTVTPGDFTIKINEEGLSVSAENVSEVYDGTGYGVSPASSLEGAAITYKDADGSYTLTTSPTRKDVGTTTVEFKASLYGYADAYGSAVVTIEKRPVTITVNSASKNYGQQDSSLTFTGTIGDGDLIDKDDLGTITYGRIASDISKENVGDDITLTASYESNANYTVTIIPGKLTIVASDENAVVITGRQVTYDGSAYGLTDAHAVREGSTLLYSTDNVTFTDNAPTFTEAGVHVVYVKATNPNYSETAVVEGKVIINKRNIAFTAGSASKTYNGNPLTNNSTTITSGSIVAGQTWTVKVTGSQTAVGTSKNVVSGAVINDGGRDVTANYDISYISGDLTVTSSGGSSGGGGGGGSSSGGGPNSSRPHTSGGPGDTTVTIDPGQIPLASLPEDNSATNLVLIDDGNIPLAGLPKTGDKAPVQGVAAIVSGLLLAAYMAFSRRRRDER